MDKDTKEIRMTVKEWAEKAGLELLNYDGFTDIYSKLSGNSSGNFYTNISRRVRDAGQLICTRKAFESRVMGCTIQFPQVSQYDKMADVIPEFVERLINTNIVILIDELRDIDYQEDGAREHIEDLLSCMKQKLNIREKSIKANGTAEEIEISELDEKEFDKLKMSIIKQYKGTVENMEAKLSEKIIKRLEETLRKKNPRLSDVQLEEIKTVVTILNRTARQKTNPKIEEEFMYVDIPNQYKEPFVQTYNVIEGNGIRPGVAFDLATEDGRVKGTMPTTPEIDAKIRQATGQEGVSISNISSAQDTDKSLQIIDSEVSVEDRRSLKTRIKEFVKKIADKIKGRKEGR